MASTEALAGWLAGGFALLTGLLTFFGLKEAKLDEALSRYPYVALVVLFLVGGAVVATAAAAAVPTAVSVRVSAVVLAIGGLVALCWKVYPDIGDLLPELWAWLIGILAVGLAVLITWQWSMGVASAVIIIASTSLGLGLYGAAKIGVLSAGFRTEIEVDAKVIRDPADAATAEIEVTVTAGGLEEHEVLRIVLLDEIDDAELGLAVGVPSVGGQLESTTKFRVAANLAMAAVRVQRCAIDRPDNKTNGPDDKKTQVPTQDQLICPKMSDETSTRFAVEAGTPSKAIATPHLAASIISADASGPATVTVTGSNAQADIVVHVVVTRDGLMVAESTVDAAEDGAVAWSAPVQVEPGVEISVRAVMEPASGDPITATATYIPPAAATTTSTTTTSTTTTAPDTVTPTTIEVPGPPTLPEPS